MSDPTSKRWPADTSPGPYADTAPCQRCGKDVALAHDEPCPHGFVACPECGWPAVCVDCRRAAFIEMCASGEYDPRADVLLDHTAPPYVPQRVVYLDGSVWRYRDNNEPVLTAWRVVES